MPTTKKTPASRRSTNPLPTPLTEEQRTRQHLAVQLTAGLFATGLYARPGGDGTPNYLVYDCPTGTVACAVADAFEMLDQITAIVRGDRGYRLHITGDGLPLANVKLDRRVTAALRGMDTSKKRDFAEVTLDVIQEGAPERLAKACSTVLAHIRTEAKK